MNTEQFQLEAKDINVWFGERQVLKDVSLQFPPNRVTALIGPSGCGKSTFIRTLNRMHELIPSAGLAGSVFLDGQDIYEEAVDPSTVRLKVGMVFQKPNPFPTMSIKENVISGLRLSGRKSEISNDLVEESLKRASMWNESKDRLDERLENVYRVNDSMFGYNLDGKRVLLYCGSNNRSFDEYIALPFTKGVTERKTGRTLLVLGSNAHHIEAMQGQFDGVLWKEEEGLEVKLFGDTIRWINVGGTGKGFIGLDYNPQAPPGAGVATSVEDIGFLCERLIEYGYDEGKRLFLLKPPYIVEREEGRKFRKEGTSTLRDYMTLYRTRYVKK
jgi:hypothetical protein